MSALRTLDIFQLEGVKMSSIICSYRHYFQHNQMRDDKIVSGQKVQMDLDRHWQQEVTVVVHKSESKWVLRSSHLTIMK